MVFDSRYKPVTELFGAPEPPKTGRGRLIYSAVKLIYILGLPGVGIDQVIADAGVTKSTFYKHFESKDELLIEAIRLRDEWEGQAFIDAVNEIGGDDPRAKLLAMFDVLDIWFNDPDFHGCQFINVAAQIPNPHDPIHKVAANHKRETRNYFRDLAVQADVNEPETFADTYTAMLEGTLILRQVHGRNDAAKIIKPAVQQLIDNS